MKTISLKDFYNKLFALANTKGKNYIHVKAIITSHNVVSFEGYVDGYGLHSGSMEEILEVFDAQMNNRQPKITDVSVELESESF